MDKKLILTEIQEICQKEGWTYQLNCKGKNWKADIVIEQPSMNIAFNVCKCPRNAESTYKIMLENNIICCWLLLPIDRYVDYDKNTPCFKLYNSNDQFKVTLYSSYYYDEGVSIDLRDFIYSFVEKKIKKANNMIVQSAEVLFINYPCWKCKTDNHVYYIKSLQSNEGITITDIDDENIIFNPQLVNAINSYIDNNGNKIKLGKIKQRYSKSNNDSYISFGCINCDLIFEKVFVDDIIYEESYSKEFIHIDMGENEFQLAVNCWYKEK